MTKASTLPATADARRAAVTSENEAHAKIPKGPYCYAGPAKGGCPCPFWATDPNRQTQDNGYCALLGTGDWEAPGMALLWDMVKECGINLDDVDEDLATGEKP